MPRSSDKLSLQLHFLLLKDKKDENKTENCFSDVCAEFFPSTMSIFCDTVLTCAANLKQMFFPMYL